ncbi:MAG: DUF5674 family protein [Nostoc sp.]
MVLIIRERATLEQVELMLQTLRVYIKVAVDIERGILAGGGEKQATTRLRITQVCFSGLEESVQKFLESLGNLNRAYLTDLEEKLLEVLESENCSIQFPVSYVKPQN